jgi:hypothetical protein
MAGVVVTPSAMMAPLIAKYCQIGPDIIEYVTQHAGRPTAPMTATRHTPTRSARRP